MSESFQEFDQSHPWVYNMFRCFVMSAIQQGESRGSTKRIIKRIRMETDMQIPTGYAALYAQKMIKEFPTTKEFFK